MKTVPEIYITSESNKRNKMPYLLFKRFCDVVISLAAIIILLPLFIFFSAVIFFYDFHNPFYLQERVGKDGKKFKIIKFRSMYSDAGDFEKYFTKEQLEHFGSEYKIENDPRITFVGRFIRKFSIDELPQLVNVLCGQMSIIGPRPLTEKETYFFGESRDKLLSVRPGITGLWQVSGRNALTYESGKRQECEIRYVDNFGLKTDFKIFLMTFKAVLGGSGQ